MYKCVNEGEYKVLKYESNSFILYCDKSDWCDYRMQVTYTIQLYKCDF